jgi:hypothetical protein
VTGCAIPDPHWHGSSSGVTVECSSCAALRAKVEELRSAWDAVADEFPGPHEGDMTDTIPTLMLRAVRGLKAHVEELTRELEDLQIEVRNAGENDTTAFASLADQGRREHERAERAEAKLARVVKASLEHLDAIGHDPDEITEPCDVGPDCTLCGLSAALAAAKEPNEGSDRC